MTTLELDPSAEKDSHVPAPVGTNLQKPEPQMGPVLKAYTFIHVLISVVAILTGLVVLGGMLVPNPLPSWTAVFLWTTVATSATGFFFPYKGFKPSYVVGALSLALLWAAIVAYDRHALLGTWRWIYVVNAVLALYLNVFVFIVQSFAKVPALKALAPTQTEPVFKKTQLIVLSSFVVLGALAVLRFQI